MIKNVLPEAPETRLARSANLTTTKLVKYMAKNKINSDGERAIFVDAVLDECNLWLSDDEVSTTNLGYRTFFQLLLKESHDHSHESRFEHIRSDLEWLHDHLLKHAKNNGYITEVKNLTDVKLLWIGKLHDEGKSRKEIADELAMIRDHYDYPFIEISTDLGRYVRERLT